MTLTHDDSRGSPVDVKNSTQRQRTTGHFSKGDGSNIQRTPERSVRLNT